MRSKSMLALCLLLLFLTACQKQTSDDPVVATYKDTQILQSEVAYEKENQINVTGDKTVSDALKFYDLPRAKASRFPEKSSEKRLKTPWVKVHVHRIC